ncbi:septum formation protein Maf [Mycoplasmatota bacterium]|nr:septum formation protein Maf [Mycoplasmatota bacterium]
MILASGSPRRSEILKREGISFRIIKPQIDEKLNSNLSVEEQVMDLAKQKALKIYERNKDETILAADTVVYYDDIVLGKPVDKEDAFRMLKVLRNRKHFVLTGVCIIKNNTTKTLYERTEIIFNNYSDQDIWEYIDTLEPMDKAGAYAIQGIGAMLVKSYKGDFDNVVGLPINKIKDHL